MVLHDIPMFNVSIVEGVQLVVNFPAEVTPCSSDTRMKFTVYKKDSMFRALSGTESDQIGSWIVSAQVGNEKVENLTKPVRMILPHAMQVCFSICFLPVFMYSMSTCR